MKSIDLAKAFDEKMKDPKLPENYTWDDFFDEYGIEKEARSDFAIAAILNQSRSIGKENA
jgi:hypothetical protein